MARETAAYDTLGNPTFAADAPVSERTAFIRRTYAHLLGAVLVFAGLEALLMNMPGIDSLARSMTTGWGWVGVLIAFMAVSVVAERMARGTTSLASQYAGLGLYIVAEAILFVPLMYVASRFGGPNIIPTAAVVTGVFFSALTVIVFASKADFSFLRSALIMGSVIVAVVAIGSMMFGFQPGILFTALIIGLACMFILYDTSNVLHHYHTTQHVAASLALFASVAYLFYHVLMLLLRMQSED